MKIVFLVVGFCMVLPLALYFSAAKVEASETPKVSQASKASVSLPEKPGVPTVPEVPVVPPPTVTTETAKTNTSTLISPKNDRIDELAGTCAIDTTPRIRALVDLNTIELRMADRMKKIQDTVKQNPKMEDKTYKELLEKAEAETIVDVEKALATPVTGDIALRALRTAESYRLLSEFQGRMALASLPNKVRVKTYEQKAANSLAKATGALNLVPSKLRAQETPRLLERLAETSLSIAQFQSLSMQETSPSKKAAILNQRLDQFRDLYSPEPHENLQLDMMEAEAYLSLGSFQLGDLSASPYVQPDIRNRFLSLSSRLENAKVNFPSLPKEEMEHSRLEERLGSLNRIVPFYAGGRGDLDKAFENLNKDMQSSDAGIRKSAEVAASFVAETQMGTYTGHRLLEAGNKWGQRPFFDNKNLQLTYNQMAQEHQDQIAKALDVNLQNRFRLPSYKEIVSGKGIIGPDYNAFLDNISEISILQEKKAKDPQSVRDEEMIDAFVRADIVWVKLQCVRMAGSGSGSTLETPFKSMKANFAPCAKASSIMDANALSTGVIDEGVVSKRNVELAWIAGEFAFDAGTAVVTGGASLAAKKAVQKGILKPTGKFLLQKGANSMVVKASVRSAGFAGGALVTDTTVGGVRGLRDYVQSGLKDGEWDVKKIQHGIPFFNPEIHPGSHAIRLLATGLGNRGMDFLWKKAPAVLAGHSRSAPLNHVLETGKNTVNAVAANSVEKLSKVPFEGTGELVSVGQDIVNPTVWGDELLNSIKGKALKGSIDSSKFLGGRHLSRSFIEKMGDLKLKTEDLGKLKELGNCLEKTVSEDSVSDPGESH